ncbi:3-phosphoglycerate kinase [Pseudomonas sp. RP23018S]|uniref:3-phosphoglycerate kinase n=1 Tax=Pseudomonas sp. RP23018S TaxID=3096037 RepID=UPI002ACAE041|nr:3-phosphoglycerate kinase [Pseudomonas sp. RP23018S]MDZ5601970.1 3-phosphoglycerate kinase [Pseudomonas sp. RP23018S]
MNRYCLSLLLCLPLAAAAYPIDVEKRLDGVKVDFTAFDTAPDMAAVTLNNYGQTAAACKVTLRNGPEAPRVRRVSVDAGQQANVTARFNREVLRLRVTMACADK